MRWFLALFLPFIAVAAVQSQSTDKPIRLIAEAEDFTVEKGQWNVVPIRENYYVATFAVSFLSRMACLRPGTGRIRSGRRPVDCRAFGRQLSGDGPL